MNNLRLCSLNVRGLGAFPKRKEVFGWLREKCFSIIFLQETHCTTDQADQWTCEWGYKAIFSGNSCSSKGVGILFNNNFNFEIIKYKADTNGRFIIVDIKIENQLYTIANIYGPNNDDPEFFKQFGENLFDFNGDHVILAGDFNLVLEVEKDKQGGNPTTHNSALQELHKIIQNLDLGDIWRALNPETKRFTWRRRKPNIQCRLDFFLISNCLYSNIIKTEINPGYKTDHSLITLSLTTQSNTTGPGLWKLNTSFLSDITFVNEIKRVIRETIDQYKEDKNVDDSLLWEMVKMNIREFSIKYGARKKKHQKTKQILLEEQVSFLEKEFESSDVPNEEILSKLQKAKTELEEIIEYKTKGAIIRSRVKWYNEGEKNSKYFLQMERRHYKRKNISSLKRTDGSILNSDKEILEECVNFYGELFSSKMENTSHKKLKELSKEFFPVENSVQLSEEQKESCEGPLTVDECLNALKTMKSGKSPGSDGFPSEFYKVFWADISMLLLKAINFAYEKGLLSISQRSGILSLLPKENKLHYFIKNWRPITLLNYDYKIFAKAIANRIKKVLLYLINSDQTGFLKGRLIGENIRTIEEIINFTEEENRPGLLLFIDFEKAFDSLEWHFIEKSLMHFNFNWPFSDRMG